MSLSRRWLLGGIAGALALFVLGFLLVVNPARQQADSLATQAEELALNNQTLSAKLTTLEKQSAEVPAKLAEIESIKKKMPTEIRQPELVRSVEQQASAAGVDLTGITPATPLTLEGSQTPTIVLPMTINAIGTYTTMKTFVDNLQRQERVFLITSLDITQSEKTAGEFELTLNGNFYSLPEGSLDNPSATGTQPQASASAKLPKRHAARHAPRQGPAGHR